MRILKNKTDSEIVLDDHDPGIVVSAEGQEDLSNYWEPWQMASSEQLLEFLGQGIDKYQLNDGLNDLSLSDAVDLIKGYSCKYDTKNGKLIARLDAPHEKDNKPVFVMSPSTEGLYTWLTSRGDDLNATFPSSGRGSGQRLYISFSEPSEKEVILKFMEPVEIHDAEAYWVGKWGFSDEWWISIRIPATEATINENQTGNCNKVEIFPGSGMNIIVPAAGDGYYDIDLNTAVPVPTKIDELGYWDVLDRWNDSIMPLEQPAYSEWNLYDFSNEMYFIAPLHCGNPNREWKLDAYKSEWISSKWEFCLRCKKVTPGPGEIGGHIMIFRPGATM